MPKNPKNKKAKWDGPTDSQTGGPTDRQTDRPTNTVTYTTNQVHTKQIEKVMVPALVMFLLWYSFHFRFCPLSPHFMVTHHHLIYQFLDPTAACSAQTHEQS